MKKAMVIILALILVLAFTAGCGKSDNGGAADNDSGAAVETNDGGAADDGAVTDEENLKGSGQESVEIDLGVNLGAVDTGGVALDGMNMDDEGSFRAGAGWDKETMVKAGDQE